MVIRGNSSSFFLVKMALDCFATVHFKSGLDAYVRVKPCISSISNDILEFHISTLIKL